MWMFTYSKIRYLTSQHLLTPSNLKQAVLNVLLFGWVVLSMISFHHVSSIAVLTWGHPWIWWSLLPGIDLLPVKVIIAALAVSTCCQRLLKIAIACNQEKGGKMVIQFFSLPRSSNEWIYKLNSSLFLFFLPVFIMQYARQWDAFKWDRVKDYCSRRGTTYITVISSAAVQFHNDKYEVSKLHHR